MNLYCTLLASLILMAPPLAGHLSVSTQLPDYAPGLRIRYENCTCRSRHPSIDIHIELGSKSGRTNRRNKL